ncbi:MAG: hypothetical protein A2Y38_02220 [Spirochaetes bacterium GWB1_59_5]|nr:MAG: hypothetical protein A2Y38_02220 [Spirochaetes bacterium GWB1_59_5]
MSKPKRIIVGTSQDLHVVAEWCLATLTALYGPEEGLARFERLSLVDAVTLYQSRVQEPVADAPVPN